MGRFLDSLSASLRLDEPAKLAPRDTASVAVILREEPGVEEVLLIRRAAREGDPWSGDVAFPGGMVSAQDRNFEETARREAWEEVGVDVSARAASFVGYMGRIDARFRNITVVPCVFRLERSPEVRPGTEVASYAWVPLESLARREARSTFVVRREGSDVPFPSIRHGDYTIWGITERIISEIVEREA